MGNASSQLEPTSLDTTNAPDGHTASDDSMAQKLAAKTERRMQREERRARKAARRASRPAEEEQRGESSTEDQYRDATPTTKRNGPNCHSIPITPRIISRRDDSEDSDAPGTQLRHEARLASERAQRHHDMNPPPSSGKALQTYQRAVPKSAKKRKSMLSSTTVDETETPAKRRKKTPQSSTTRTTPLPASTTTLPNSAPGTMVTYEKRANGRSFIKPLDPVKHGRMSEEETRTIDWLVREHMDKHSLTQEEMNENIASNAEGIADLYYEMQKAVLHRTRRAIIRYCQRHYHNLARGKFDREEDEAIRKAYAERPDAWAWIAAQVGRLPGDCRDRWRDYLVYGDDRIVDLWYDDETQRFYQALKTCLERLQESGDMGPDTTIEDLAVEDVQWLVVAEIVGTRNRVQCRGKWTKAILARENASFKATQAGDSELKSTPKHKTPKKRSRARVPTSDERINDDGPTQRQPTLHEVVSTNKKREARAMIKKLDRAEAEVREESLRRGKQTQGSHSLEDKCFMLEQMIEVLISEKPSSRTVFWNALESRFDDKIDSRLTNNDRKALSQALLQADAITDVLDLGELEHVLNSLRICIPGTSGIKSSLTKPETKTKLKSKGSPASVMNDSTLTLAITPTASSSSRPDSSNSGLGQTLLAAVPSSPYDSSDTDNVSTKADVKDRQSSEDTNSDDVEVEGSASVHIENGEWQDESGYGSVEGSPSKGLELMDSDGD